MFLRVRRAFRRTVTGAAPGVRQHWHQGRAIVAGYRHDPDAAEHVMRVSTTVAAVLVTLLRRRDRQRVDLAGYERDRAKVEQVVRGAVVLGAALAAHGRRPSTQVFWQRTAEACRPRSEMSAGSPTPRTGVIQEVDY